MGAEAANIAGRRQTNVASLRRLVDGDLNRVAMKALEKKGERRYSSVTELAADIQRYLEHGPVLAAPPAALYPARKFVRRHRPAVFGTAAAFAFMLLSGVTVLSLARRDLPPKPKLTDKRTIVLADFANATGDRAFGDPLRRVMAGELEKSPYLSVLSDARMSETLRLMIRPADTKFTPDVASEICERTASGAVVEGSVTSLGSEYVLGLRVRNCRTGDVLDDQQASTARKEEVFKDLGQMANRFGSRAAESLPSVQKEPSLPSDATTPSLAAWRSYSAAMKILQRGAQTAESIPLLKRAVEIDPKFAMAYAYLGRQQANFGETDLGAKNTAKAYELRNQVSDQENDFITFSYHRQVTGNLSWRGRAWNHGPKRLPGISSPRILSGLHDTGTGSLH